MLNKFVIQNFNTNFQSEETIKNVQIFDDFGDELSSFTLTKKWEIRLAYSHVLCWQA